MSSEWKEVLVWKNYNAGGKWIQYVPVLKNGDIFKGTLVL